MLDGTYQLSATVNNGYADQKVVYDNFNVGYIENSSLSSATLSVADNGIQQNIFFQISGVGPNAGNPDIHVHTVYSGAVTMKGSVGSEPTVEGTINARNYISIEKGKIDQIKEDYQSSRTMTLIGTDLVGIESSAKIRNNCGKGKLYGDFLSQISSLIINNAEGCYTLDELPAPGGDIPYQKVSLNKDGVKYTAEKNGDCSTLCSVSAKYEFDNVKYRNFMLDGSYELSATVNNGYVDQKIVYDNFNVGYTENSSLSSQILSVADNGIRQNIKFEISGVGPNAGNPDIHVRTVYHGAVTMKGSVESVPTVEGTIKATNYISIEEGKIDQIKEDYQSSRTMTLIGDDLMGIELSSIIRNNCGKGKLYGYFQYKSQFSSNIEAQEEGCYELPAPVGNSDNTTTIIIVVVVVVVLLIAAGVGGFFLWKKFGSKKDEKEASV
jgi:hypothetical protein